VAFDYGSIDLGLKNPFKNEGRVTAVRGVISAGLGLYLLFSAVAIVKESQINGWILVGFGLFLLTLGLKDTGSGIFAILRYFVGRNHPTSLAYNYSKTESEAAQQEKSTVAYTAKNLEEMLVGRKNSTFVEPQGFMARMVHTLFPKLLFLPYPIRNMTQRLIGAWVKSIVALVSYGFAAFVSLTGLAGELGEKIFPAYSFVLLVYLLLVWRKASLPVSRKAEKNIESLGSSDLAGVISVSIVLPVASGFGLAWLANNTHFDMQQWDTLAAFIPSVNVGLFFLATAVLAATGSFLFFTLIGKRSQTVNPVTEVSELRENWQESVHPNEIFINLDNLVMANRRYKEVPNRVYRELDPQLEEQVQGKGGFKGELIQEIQPKVHPVDYGPVFGKFRGLSLILGNVLFVSAAVCTFFLAYLCVDLHRIFPDDLSALSDSSKEDELKALVALLSSGLTLLLLGSLLKSFASLLSSAAHIFYAEIQFESLLIYFKCEGTFSESKISTGSGIYDSTQSENTLVRSSITPWVIVSKIVTSTFAGIGAKNLEHPRQVLEMHKSDDELFKIKEDVVAFLKDRESIAAITSERDLGNASQIHQLNQQTRAMPNTPQGVLEAEAAGGHIARTERTD